MRLILRENLFYLCKYTITSEWNPVILGTEEFMEMSCLSHRSLCHRLLAHYWKCVQYKRAECRLLLSEMAFTMMRIFLQNHRLGASWVSHIPRKRDIEMEKKLQGRKQRAGLRFLCFCILQRSFSFTLYRNSPALAYASITNPAGQTQSCGAVFMPRLCQSCQPELI